jgi:hypothetical protein
MDSNISEEYETYKNDIEKTIFLQIGISISSDQQCTDQQCTNLGEIIHIKSINEQHAIYLEKIQKQLQDNLVIKTQLFDKISSLTQISIETMSNCKENHIKIKSDNIFYKFRRNYFIKQLEIETTKYCEIFDKLSFLHEDLLGIETNIHKLEQIIEDIGL